MASAHPHILMVFDAMLVGGTETHVLALTRSLIQHGVRVTICADDGPLLSDFQSLGCTVHTVPFMKARTPKQRKNIQRQMQTIIDKGQFTAVHLHQMHSGQMVFPVIKRNKLGTVLTVHGNYYILSSMTPMKRYGTRFIAVSPPIRKLLRGGGIHAVTIPNGIDLKRYRPKKSGADVIRQKLHLPKDADIVLYASRLSWDKATVAKEVINAAAKLRRQGNQRVHLVIVGGGNSQRSIQNFAKSVEHQVGDHFIHFYGVHRHMRTFYVMSNCVVGTGRVALEALACGRPVVAVGSEGLVGRLSPDKLNAAWHYYFGDHAAPQPHSSSKLAAQIQHVLDSKARQERYGSAGRTFVEEKFNSDKIAQDTIGLYRKIMK